MLLGSFENDLITVQSFFVGFVLKKRIWTQSLGEVKSLTINISYSSQISAGHGAQLALQFNGKVNRRDMD